MERSRPWENLHNATACKPKIALEKQGEMALIFINNEFLPGKALCMKVCPWLRPKIRMVVCI